MHICICWYWIFIFNIMARRKRRKVSATPSLGKSDKQLFLDTQFDSRPLSNHVNGKYIDRIYGSGNLMRLIQEDGTIYQGAISTKRKRHSQPDGSGFWQTLYVTKDDRWFDNGGMPMKKPEEVNDDNKIEEPEEPETRS